MSNPDEFFGLAAIFLLGALIGFGVPARNVVVASVFVVLFAASVIGYGLTR